MLRVRSVPWSFTITRCLSGLYLGVLPVHVACQDCTLESHPYMLRVRSVPWSLTSACYVSGLYLGVSPVHVTCQVCTLESHHYTVLVRTVPGSLTRTCCLSGLYLGVSPVHVDCQVCTLESHPCTCCLSGLYSVKCPELETYDRVNETQYRKTNFMNWARELNVDINIFVQKYYFMWFLYILFLFSDLK